MYDNNKKIEYTPCYVFADLSEAEVVYLMREAAKYGRARRRQKKEEKLKKLPAFIRNIVDKTEK
jgi:hypothetical protein